MSSGVPEPEKRPPRRTRRGLLLSVALAAGVASARGASAQEGSAASAGAAAPTEPAGGADPSGSQEPATAAETSNSADANAAPETTDAAADNDLSKLMGMSLEELLDTNVTTASKSGEKESSAPGVMSVVTKDELRRFRGNSLGDILNRVPSLISSSTAFSDRRTLAARGDQIRLDSGHVLFLINGRPTRESLQGGVSSEILESFPVNVIERIEVIRGPGSVLYGSNAFSAVVNIITEEPKAGASATLEALGGVPGSYGAAAKASAQLGDLGVVVAARQLERADWKTVYRYSPEGTSAVIDTNIAIPDLRQGAYLELDYKGLRFMSNFDRWENAYFFRGNIGANHWQRAFGDLGYQLHVLDALNWDMEFHGTYTYAGSSASDVPGTQGQSHEVLGEWTNFLRFGEHLRLVAGGLYDYARGKETYLASDRRLTVSDASRTSGAAYAQLQHQALDSLELIAGVQLDLCENISPRLVPRAGVIWNPFDGITFKGLYGQAFRAPSINEIGLRHPELWGQPDLKPEVVHAIDAGVSYTGERLSLGANYFFTQQKDIIKIDDTPSTRIAAPSYYNNLGKISIQGVELETKYYATTELYFTGSLLYFQSKDATGNEAVTPIPSLGAKLGASYYSQNGLSASVFDVYQGNWDRAYSARLNPDPTAYHLLSATLGFDFATVMGKSVVDSLTLFVEAEGLLDQELWLPDWGGVVAESIPMYPGRTIYFGLSATFGSGHD